MLTTNLKFLLKSRGVCVAAAVVLLVIGCRAQSKTGTSANNSAPVNTASKIKFSSAYTKLNPKNCQPISKAESETDEIPLVCKGYKGYKIFLAEHGVFPPMYIGREISANLDSWNPSDYPSFIQTGSGDQVIEWRLANGEPFAVIVRSAYDKQLVDPDEKGTVNNLVVRNLKGFAPVDIVVNAAKNKRANQQARRAADAGYGKL